MSSVPETDATGEQAATPVVKGRASEPHPHKWLTVLSTFLSCAVWTLSFQKADAGCFVLGVGGVLLRVPEDL